MEHSEEFASLVPPSLVFLSDVRDEKEKRSGLPCWRVGLLYKLSCDIARYFLKNNMFCVSKHYLGLFCTLRLVYLDIYIHSDGPPLTPSTLHTTCWTADWVTHISTWIAATAATERPIAIDDIARAYYLLNGPKLQNPPPLSFDHTCRRFVV